MTDSLCSSMTKCAYDHGYSAGRSEMLKAISDIKAEIERVVCEEADDESWSRGLHYALKIIDKHMSGKETQ